ncbi:4Fe-4S dicluster domain-containing protein [Guggenheimella bovis]
MDRVVSASEVKRLKGLGFLKDKRYPNIFNVRVITRNGKITAKEQKIIAEAAEKFGSGEIALTTRLTMEIQGVPYEKSEEIIAFLKEHDLETGGTGALVRPVVSCKGTTCQYGLYDTYELSESIHNRFYKGYRETKLPHKFKIGVGGCPNNCIKPDLNDFGIMGQRFVKPDLEKCRGCNVCQVQVACPVKACEVKEGKLSIDEEKCIRCGRCFKKCPFGVIEQATPGFKVFIGGRWGKKVNQGIPLKKVFFSKEEVEKAIEKTLDVYMKEGKPGERFRETIDRVGFEHIQEQILE